MGDRGINCGTSAGRRECNVASPGTTSEQVIGIVAGASSIDGMLLWAQVIPIRGSTTSLG